MNFIVAIILPTMTKDIDNEPLLVASSKQFFLSEIVKHLNRIFVS